jgi:hypothetical protein
LRITLQYLSFTSRLCGSHHLFLAGMATHAIPFGWISYQLLWDDGDDWLGHLF